MARETGGKPGEWHHGSQRAGISKQGKWLRVKPENRPSYNKDCTVHTGVSDESERQDPNTKGNNFVKLMPSVTGYGLHYLVQ